MSFSPSSSSSDSSGSRVLEWELGLPSADDLTPLSQTLVSPSLASAFSISPHPSLSPLDLDLASRTSFNALAAAADPSPNPKDPPPSKRARLLWTPQLHRRFVDVVSHLGVANAVPKTVMQMMNVEGLTRENVASHLQKYRLYLKRVNDPNPPAGSDPGFFDSAPDPIGAQEQQKQQQHPMQYMMQMPVFHNYGFYDTYHR